MNKKIILGVLLALVLIAVAVGIGAQAYRIGVMQGLAASGKLDASPTGVAPAPFAYRAWGVGMHRPGFGLLSCVFPLLFLFLFFGLMRAFACRGHWGMHHPRFEGGAPPMFEEWHRKMHEQPKPAEQK